jgi:hypothetical protein
MENEWANELLVYVHYMNLLHGNVSTGILFGVNKE